MWTSSKSALPNFSAPLVNNEAPPNAKLVTEDGMSFDVHRAILAQHSVFFSKLFTHESQKELFHLGGISSPTLRNILSWMYSVSTPTWAKQRPKSLDDCLFDEIRTIIIFFSHFSTNLTKASTSTQLSSSSKLLITSKQLKFSKSPSGC